MLNWLSKADTGVDVVVRWITVIGLMVAAYTWLASKLAWFGPIGLAEMIALAIPSALITLLAVTGSLALYRYFRPLGGVAAPQPQPSDDLAGWEVPIYDLQAQAQTEIFPKFEELKDAIGKLASRLEALEGDLPQIEVDPTPNQLLGRLQVMADAYEAKERFALLQERLSVMQKALPQPPPAENRELLLEDYSRIWGHHFVKFTLAEKEFDAQRSSLARLGFPTEELNKAVETERQRIIADAQYLAILSEDAQFLWRTGEEKRNWYLREAPLRVQLSYFGTMARDLYERSNFVEKLAHG